MSGTRAVGSVASSTVARAFRAVARLGSLLLAARLFPMETVGDFAFLLGVGTLGAGILDLGLTTLLQRERGLSGTLGPDLERRALVIRLITIGPALAASWAIGGSIIGRWNPFDLGSIAFAGAITLADFLGGIRRARGDFSGEARELGSLALAAAAAFGLQVMVRYSFDTFQVLLGSLTLAIAAGRAWALWRGIGVAPLQSSALSGAGRLLWRSRWMWAIGLGALLLFELPVVILRGIVSPEDVALFAAAQRATGLASQPFAILAGVFIPALAWSHGNGDAEYDRILGALNRLLLSAFPAVLGMAILVGSILLRGFGAAYVEALPLIWVLAVGTLIYLGAPSAGHPLIQGRERELALLSLGGSGLVVIAIAILTPSLGLLGAALGISLSLAFCKLGHAVLYWLEGRRALDRKSAGWGLALAVWLGTLGAVSTTWRVAVLTVGVALSIALSASLLMRVRLEFGEGGSRSESTTTRVSEP